MSWQSQGAGFQSQRLQRILLENIVPYWRGRAGGGLILRARVLWFWSRLASSPYGGLCNEAERAFGDLCELWDAQWGGFFWSSEAQDKHLYGQAFGLYALSEFAAASGSASALEMANTLAERLAGAHDAHFGGFCEDLQRDWTPSLAATAGRMGAEPAEKTMNCHLHLLEAYTRYFELTACGADLLGELLTICTAAVVRRGSYCLDTHGRDWSSRGGSVSFGHQLENIWLTARTARALGQPLAPLLGMYRNLFAYAYAFGFDRRGGFYDQGYPWLPAHRRDKIWWVQAEALVACLEMQQLTGERFYGECFCKTLDWIERRQLDSLHGEWFERIDYRGQARGAKSGLWKGPYHNGRAMLECLERLGAGVVG